VKASSTVLNGGREETCRKVTRLAPTHRLSAPLRKVVYRRGRLHTGAFATPICRVFTGKAERRQDHGTEIL